MHHAHDLNQFIAQAARVLKKGGLLLTVRDHVIYDEADKLRFLEAHPLHRYYGGENAFTEAEYRRAFELAGLRVDKIFKYFDNVINYYPNDSTVIEKSRPHQKYLRNWQQSIYMKIPYLRRWLNRKVTEQYGIVLDETVVAGRLYTFVGIKQ
jgi:SAM-dependent methyltransferase